MIWGKSEVVKRRAAHTPMSVYLEMPKQALLLWRDNTVYERISETGVGLYYTNTGPPQ